MTPEEAIKIAAEQIKAREHKLVALLYFTREQFDSGLAHDIVRDITDKADVFPGEWWEHWRYSTLAERWEVVLERTEE